MHGRGRLARDVADGRRPPMRVRRERRARARERPGEGAVRVAVLAPDVSTISFAPTASAATMPVEHEMWAARTSARGPWRCGARPPAPLTTTTASPADRSATARHFVPRKAAPPRPSRPPPRDRNDLPAIACGRPARRAARECARVLRACIPTPPGERRVSAAFAVIGAAPGFARASAGRWPPPRPAGPAGAGPPGAAM